MHASMRRTLCLLWGLLAALPLSAQVRTETLIHTFDGGQAKAVVGESALQSAPIALGVAGPPFVAVAPMLHYAGPVDEAARIWLQTSADGRSWDRWIEVQPDPHIEAEANRLYGNLVFFPATAHYLRYRLSPPADQARPLELRLDIINPGSSASRRAQRIAAAGAKPYALPDYVPRRSWGSSLGLEDASSRMTPITVTHLWVHHSAGQTNSRDFAAVVRAYFTYHTQTHGWADIGYNWLVDPRGTLYQGRAFRRHSTSGAITMDVQGAHARGANARSLGVCMIGDYTARMPAEIGLRKLVELFAWKARQMPLEVLSTGPINGRSYDIVSGHRDISNTACPGDTFYPYLPMLRQRVHALLYPPIVAELEAEVDAREASAAQLSARVDPQGSRTVWYFEYGTRAGLNDAAATAAEELRDADGGPSPVQARLYGLVQGTTYYYRLVAVNSDTLTYSSVQQFAAGQITLVEPGSSSPRPQTLTLSANYPNPFNASTQIRFSLPVPTVLQLSIYDVLGREVAVVAAGYYAAGEHLVSFHPDHLPSGVYIYRLRAGNETRSRAMLLLK